MAVFIQMPAQPERYVEDLFRCYRCGQNEQAKYENVIGNREYCDDCAAVVEREGESS